MSTPPVIVDRVFPQLAALAGALDAEINAAVTQHLVGVPLCFCGVRHGAGMTLDYVGSDSCQQSDGMGWVAIETVYPSTNYPQPSNSENCGALLAVHCVMGVVRSYPVHEDGSPLAVNEELAYSAQAGAEMLIMRKVLACTSGTGNMMIGAYTPIGPVGAAIGGLWRFVISDDIRLPEDD